MLNLTDPMGTYFTDAGRNRWHCQRTGVDLANAQLDFFRKYEGIFGLPLTNEISLGELPDTAIVVYERAVAIYDPSHKYDDQPEAGPVYLLHIDSGVGQQIIAKSLVTALQQQIEQLQQNTDLEVLRKQIAGCEQALHQIYLTSSQFEGKAS